MIPDTSAPPKSFRKSEISKASRFPLHTFSPSALTIYSSFHSTLFAPPFHYLPSAHSTATEGRNGAPCQNGAKAGNATAHPYNVADMRGSERGRVALERGACRRCVPSCLSPVLTQTGSESDSSIATVEYVQYIPYTYTDIWPSFRQLSRERLGWDGTRTSIFPPIPVFPVYASYQPAGCPTGRMGLTKPRS